MTDDTALLLIITLALAAYAIGLLRRLSASEAERVEAVRMRQESEVWADKWEAQSAELVQANGDLRRQHAALQAQHASLQSQHASLQAMYALRTRELLLNSREIVEINVAWKRNGK